MLNMIEQFPADTLAVVKPMQADPNYLAALDTLCAVKGLAKIAHGVQFVAEQFSKSFAEVIIDAAQQSAVAGTVFGA